MLDQVYGHIAVIITIIHTITIHIPPIVHIHQLLPLPLLQLLMRLQPLLN
jgi:hypothetical protein